MTSRGELSERLKKTRHKTAYVQAMRPRESLYIAARTSKDVNRNKRRTRWRNERLYKLRNDTALSTNTSALTLRGTEMPLQALEEKQLGEHEASEHFGSLVTTFKC